MTKIEKLAVEVAISAPWKPNKYVTHAKVPWSVIEALRAALEEGGTDWRPGKRAYDKIVLERRAAARRR